MPETNVLTNVITLSQDEYSRTITTVDHPHSEIHEGCTFFIQTYLDYTGGDNSFADAVILVGEKDAHIEFEIKVDQNFTVDIYEGCTYSALAFEIPNWNANRNSTTVSTTKFYGSPTITDTGTLVFSSKFGAAKALEVKRSGIGERILKRNTAYLVRGTKRTALAAYYDWAVTWYEHNDESE